MFGKISSSWLPCLIFFHQFETRVWHKLLWAVVHRTTSSEDLVVLQFFWWSWQKLTLPHLGILNQIFFWKSAMCYHIVNFVKPQKASRRMAGDSSRMMIDLNVNNSWPQVICSIKRVREGAVFLVLSPASCNDCFYLWGMLPFWLGLDILVVHRTTGYECSGGPTWFLVVSDHRTTVSCERWRRPANLMSCRYIVQQCPSMASFAFINVERSVRPWVMQG